MSGFSNILNKRLSILSIKFDEDIKYIDANISRFTNKINFC